MVREMTAAEERDDVVYAIIGPTAAGKTHVGFELARRINAEIISVDSRQVYRYLDVGTDKISREDCRIVPHHLVDVADPDEIFTTGDFLVRAGEAIRRIRARGRIPLLVGGTPMYYKALEGNFLSENLPKDEKMRAKLEAEAEARGLQSLHTEMSEADPIGASRIHPNDKVRILRALELFRLTGRSSAELYASERKMGIGRRIVYFAITLPREQLYKKIEDRAACQFQSGYPEEVKWLLAHGYSRELPALSGFGYRELVMFLDGSITFDEALCGDIKSTKAFSRRQATWFRKFHPILWYDLSKITMSKTVEDMAMKVSSGFLG
ncbi:MAG: tRNA (adenosine(37)-N6)-dimethylallyltransferase MiaA [Synergistaceae bacterium]|jgi:tRNA dimethylallyltransferase|nr:tRNA (adenosine(37)-N6)-dimethylallyltransferase MiaA [Synergistaceae bacterium]